MKIKTKVKGGEEAQFNELTGMWVETGLRPAAKSEPPKTVKAG